MPDARGDLELADLGGHRVDHRRVDSTSRRFRRSRDLGD